jgi:hypothetical protein
MIFTLLPTPILGPAATFHVDFADRSFMPISESEIGGEEDHGVRVMNMTPARAKVTRMMTMTMIPFLKAVLMVMINSMTMRLWMTLSYK